MSFPLRCMSQILRDECMILAKNHADLPPAAVEACKDCISKNTCPISRTCAAEVFSMLAQRDRVGAGV